MGGLFCLMYYRKQQNQYIMNRRHKNSRILHNFPLQQPPISTLHSPQFPYCSSCRHSLKSHLSQVLEQNSELRKIIYQLQHEISTIKIQTQSKQFDFKKVIQQYRNVLAAISGASKNGQNYNYNQNQGITQEGYDQGDLSGEAGGNNDWVERRGQFYYQYLGQQSEQMAENQSFSMASSQKSSFSIDHQTKRNQSKKQTPQNRSKQLRSKDKLNENQKTGLDPIDCLHFKTDSNPEQIPAEETETPVLSKKQTKVAQYQQNPTRHLPTLSSITEPFPFRTPHSIQYLELDQIPTLTLSNPHRPYQNIMHPLPTFARRSPQDLIPKAETDRIEKSHPTQRKQMKSSGRISSEGCGSNQSFRKIVEKGRKNRDRIQELLRNFGKG